MCIDRNKGGGLKSLEVPATGPVSQEKFSRRDNSGEKKFSGTESLFGPLADAVIGIDLPSSFACSECGSAFHQTKTNGRPQKFCSAECRAKSKRRQVREWEAARRSPVRIEFATCRHCFRVFEVPPRPGRLPHFCSPACKLASSGRPAPAPEPGGFGDLFNPTQRRKIP